MENATETGSVVSEKKENTKRKNTNRGQKYGIL
jgi:hypothetical protein